MVILLLTLRTTLQRVTTILSKLSSMHIITFRTESRIKCKEITIEVTEYTLQIMEKKKIIMGCKVDRGNQRDKSALRGTPERELSEYVYDLHVNVARPPTWAKFIYGSKFYFMKIYQNILFWWTLFDIHFTVGVVPNKKLLQTSAILRE